MKKAPVVVVSAVCVVLGLAGQANAAIYYGTDGQDFFTGTSGIDTFWTYAGDDTVHGAGSRDNIHLGDGNDLGTGDDGPDLLYAGMSTVLGIGDEIRGNNGNDEGYDEAGPDSDGFCGGPNDDYVNLFDGDGYDAANMGAGTDNWSKDPGDYVDPDAGC